MKHRLPITVLMALAMLTPTAAEAQDNSNPRQLKTTQAKSKRTLKDKDTDLSRPDLPDAGSLVGADASPDAHPAKYQDFLSKLDEQVKNNSADACEAMSVALSATGNEFCLDLWMQKAAEEGNAAAMHYMGMTAAARNASPEMRYLRGRERDALAAKQLDNAKAAAEWLKKAADKKFVPALLDYSTFLRLGIGVLKNEQAANRMMLEAAKSGTFETRYSWLLGNGRLEKWNDRERPEVASEIKRGNHLVIYYMSSFAPDSRTQFDWLLDAAKKGSPDAMYSLAAVLQNSKPQESYKLLKAAVAKHNAAAMYVYGSFLVSEPGEYHQQNNLRQNIPLGVGVLRLAAMMGNAQSRRTMLTAYYRGDFGLPKDKAKTYAHLQWLNTAQYDPISMAAQGFMLLTGEGIEQNTATGLRYITLAANAPRAPYSYARVMLAYAHYKGIGVAQNTAMAVEVLQEAAAAGFAHAYLYIAYLSAKGLHGKAPDMDEAKRYVNIAALNMGDAAQRFFDEQMKEEDWVIGPFPLEEK